MFSSRINLLFGPNGIGKTNVLDAIHFLCLSKGFVQGQDQYAVRNGTSLFELAGTLHTTARGRRNVRVAYAPGDGKRVFINKAPIDRVADVVGQFPVVVVSPADYRITSEGPEERRRFLDNILCQSRPVYLHELLKYRRILKQRNALLATRQVSPGVLEPWTEELVASGSTIVDTRASFLDRFNEYLRLAFAYFEDVGEVPSIAYQTQATSAEAAGRNETEASFRRRLERNATREREQRRTLLGPHRDELILKLNEMEVRRYASQGQHRTFGLALKLAQFLYLKDELEETPLLLLDDVFGNLDRRRTEIFLNLLRNDPVGQSFVTATEREPFEAVIDFTGEENSAIGVGAKVSREP